MKEEQMKAILNNIMKDCGPKKFCRLVFDVLGSTSSFFSKSDVKDIVQNFQKQVQLHHK